MSWVVDDDGFVIDDETGEVIDPANVHPDDILASLAMRAKAAEEQRKAWETTERGYKRGILNRLLPGEKVPLGSVGLTASVRQARPNILDVPAFIDMAMGMELKREEMLDILGAITGLNGEKLSTESMKQLADMLTREVPRSPYAVVDVLKRAAPKRKEPEE